MLNIFKKFMQLRRKKQLDRYKRMNSEILCAIAYDVYKKQEVQDLKVPAFMLINNRYKELNISTPKDLIKTYTQLYLQGAVSGVEL